MIARAGPGGAFASASERNQHAQSGQNSLASMPIWRQACVDFVRKDVIIVCLKFRCDSQASHEKPHRNPRRQRDHDRQRSDGVQKAEVNKSGRNGVRVKMKLRNSLSGSGRSVYRDDEKFDVFNSERQGVSIPNSRIDYVFMDSELQRSRSSARTSGTSITDMEEGRQLAPKLTLYDGKPISVELPTSVCVRSHTEPAVQRRTLRGRYSSRASSRESGR